MLNIVEKEKPTCESVFYLVSRLCKIDEQLPKNAAVQLLDAEMLKTACCYSQIHICGSTLKYCVISVWVALIFPTACLLIYNR